MVYDMRNETELKTSVLCPIQIQLHLCTSLLLTWELVTNSAALKFLGTVSHQ